MQGFTLIETLIVLFILTFGLMSAGQLLYLAIGSGSLAGSKGNATLVADSKLAFLMDLYRRDPDAADLGLGDHGREVVQVCNPKTTRVLNRFEVSWRIEAVPDPRPGKKLRAYQVRVTAVPVDMAGNPHFVAFLNKIVTITSVISLRSS